MSTTQSLTAKTTQYAGIDYGRGNTNIDNTTGIRFGVISQHSVGESWYDSAEADYGMPHCPKCGNSADKPEAFGETFMDGIPENYTHERHECDDYVCVDCQHAFGSESAFGDEPCGFYVDHIDFKAHCGQDGDIFVTRSAYFTYAQFCSPCAPGACHLENPLEHEQFTVTENDVANDNNVHPDDVNVRLAAGTYPHAPSTPNNRAYCFGHEWFEGGVAPYPVYSVATGKRVMS